MAEHDWEELFILRDDPRGSGQMDPLYAGLDRCRNCRLLRSTVALPFCYMKPNWIRQTPSLGEPACKEAEG